MPNLNRVTLIGNTTRDPEVRYMPDGNPVANVSLATNRSWKGKDGEKHEEAEFHRLTFYGKLAEIVGEYVKKGRPIYVEGRLHTRKWADKDGSDRYTTEIICDQMQLLGARDDAGGGQSRESNSGSHEWQQSRATTKRHAPAAGGFDEMSDDIPFANPYRGRISYVV